MPLSGLRFKSNMLVNLLGQWCLESQVKNLQAKKADSKQKDPGIQKKNRWFCCHKTLPKSSMKITLDKLDTSITDDVGWVCQARFGLRWGVHSNRRPVSCSNGCHACFKLDSQPWGQASFDLNWRKNYSWFLMFLVWKDLQEQRLQRRCG